MTTPTPPPWMFAAWNGEVRELFPAHDVPDIVNHVARRAYATGVARERTACVEWLARSGHPQAAADLQEARTPRTDREKALRLLETFGCAFVKLSAEQVALIRRVVEEGQP